MSLPASPNTPGAAWRLSKTPKVSTFSSTGHREAKHLYRIRVNSDVIRQEPTSSLSPWIPACAGMTQEKKGWACARNHKARPYKRIRYKPEIILYEEHGAGDHARVVTKEQTAQGRDARYHVHIRVSVTSGGGRGYVGHRRVSPRSYLALRPTV